MKLTPLSQSGIGFWSALAPITWLVWGVVAPMPGTVPGPRSWASAGRASRAAVTVSNHRVLLRYAIGSSPCVGTCGAGTIAGRLSVRKPNLFGRNLLEHHRRPAAGAVARLEGADRTDLAPVVHVVQLALEVTLHS